jgi:hypothetical protein
MDTKILLTTPTLETAFGDAPFDIYSYKGIYRTPNQIEKVFKV